MEDQKKLFTDMSEQVIEMSQSMEIKSELNGIEADRELVNNAIMRIDFIGVAMHTVLEQTFALIMEQHRNKD